MWPVEQSCWVTRRIFIGSSLQYPHFWFWFVANCNTRESKTTTMNPCFFNVQVVNKQLPPRTSCGSLNVPTPRARCRCNFRHSLTDFHDRWHDIWHYWHQRNALPRWVGGRPTLPEEDRPRAPKEVLEPSKSHSEFLSHSRNEHHSISTLLCYVTENSKYWEWTFL